MNSLNRLKLGHSPLVETWLSADFSSTKQLSLDGLKKIIEQEFKNEKIVQLLSERKVDIQDNGDFRTETITENRGAGAVVDFKAELPMQVVLKNGRVECKVLGSYPEWNSFILLAKTTLENCVKYMGEVSYQKISVRSVNKINFMNDERCFSNVLRMLPLDPADDLQGVCADMFYRDTQYYPEYKAYATIVRAYQRQRDADKSGTPIFLDIDVFKLRQQGEELYLNETNLDAIHQLKNRLFVGAITEKQLSYYK